MIKRIAVAALVVLFLFSGCAETVTPQSESPTVSPSEISVSPALPSADANSTPQDVTPQPEQSPPVETPTTTPEITPKVTLEPTPETTPDETPEVESPPVSVDIITVFVAHVDGEVLRDCEIEYTEKMTAFDALEAALDTEGLSFKSRGSGAMVYIVSIGEYTERSDGAMSGWVFKHNGEQLSKGCGAVELSAGDRVSFYFSRDMGKDVSDLD